MKEMIGKIVAVASALVVGLVLTATPSQAATKTQGSLSSGKGKIVFMAGPPLCCGSIAG